MVYDTCDTYVQEELQALGLIACLHGMLLILRVRKLTGRQAHAFTHTACKCVTNPKHSSTNTFIHTRVREERHKHPLPIKLFSISWSQFPINVMQEMELEDPYIKSGSIWFASLFFSPSLTQEGREHRVLHICVILFPRLTISKGW